MSGCGGLLCDNDGQWICVASQSVWEILLHMQQNFVNIELQIDSRVVADCLVSNGWNLVKSINRLLAENWVIKIVHVYREANKSADYLTNLACDLGSCLIVYESPSSLPSQVLLSESMGVRMIRV